MQFFSRKSFIEIRRFKDKHGQSKEVNLFYLEHLVSHLSHFHYFNICYNQTYFSLQSLYFQVFKVSQTVSSICTHFPIYPCAHIGPVLKVISLPDIKYGLLPLMCLVDQITCRNTCYSFSLLFAELKIYFILNVKSDFFALI